MHPHFNSSEHEATVSGSNVQNGCHPCVALFCQPYVSGEGINGQRTSACPHTYPPWYTVRFVCWVRAALVGGKLSIDLPLVVNMCFLAKSTVVSVQVRSYKSTTNAPNTDMQSSFSFHGSINKIENTGMTSLKYFHMSHAVFFPCQQTKTQCHNPYRHGTWEGRVPFHIQVL